MKWQLEIHKWPFIFIHHEPDANLRRHETIQCYKRTTCPEQKSIMITFPSKVIAMYYMVHTLNCQKLHLLFFINKPMNLILRWRVSILTLKIKLVIKLEKI